MLPSLRAAGLACGALARAPALLAQSPSELSADALRSADFRHVGPIGNRVYRSTDGGESWEELAAGEVAGFNRLLADRGLSPVVSP